MKQMNYKRKISASYLVIMLMLILILTSCASEKEIEFYKTYDQNNGSVSEKINVIPIDKEFYIQIKLDKPFNTDHINIVMYKLYNAEKDVIAGSSKSVDANSNKVVIPFTLSKEGEYKIDVYADDPENIIASSNLKVQGK